jgi:hypothetical protein
MISPRSFPAIAFSTPFSPPPRRALGREVFLKTQPFRYLFTSPRGGETFASSNQFSSTVFQHSLNCSERLYLSSNCERKSLALSARRKSFVERKLELSRDSPRSGEGKN